MLALASLCASSPAFAQSASSSTSSKKKTVAAPSRRAHSTVHPATQTSSRPTPSLRSRSKQAGLRAASAKTTSKKINGKRKSVPRGQQKIDPERAQAIQEALIREQYLSGEAAGTWNEASEAAMRRYQADHGWQSKTVPDSRALISLGLGPSHDHLLNPESAMTTEPDTRAVSLTPASHSADPGERMNANPARAGDPAVAATPDKDAPSPR